MGPLDRDLSGTAAREQRLRWERAPRPNDGVTSSMFDFFQSEEVEASQTPRIGNSEIGIEHRRPDPASPHIEDVILPPRRRASTAYQPVRGVSLHHAQCNDGVTSSMFDFFRTMGSHLRCSIFSNPRGSKPPKLLGLETRRSESNIEDLTLRPGIEHRRPDPASPHIEDVILPPRRRASTAHQPVRGAFPAPCSMDGEPPPCVFPFVASPGDLS
jgi:hypothetical protein